MAPPPPPPPRRRRVRAKSFPTFSEARRAYYQASDKADDDWVQQRYRAKHYLDRAGKVFAKRRTVQRRQRERRARNAIDKAVKTETRACIQEHWADRFADYAYDQADHQAELAAVPLLKEEDYPLNEWQAWGCDCRECV